MDLELRHLRCLVAIVDSGTFTDAAIELGISQAAVSRNLMALEQVLGVRLLHRTSRTVTPTTAGVHVLAQARQILAAAGNLVAEATTGHTRLRIGHAWSAMGRHTREFQRRWAAAYPDVELQLIRTNSATGGLAEGLCDIAVLRTEADARQFASAVVGHERRFCALAADDPWARRRSIRLDEIPQRVVLIDRRTGTTTPDLWPDGERPRVRDTRDIDDWLAIIAAGGGIGITPEGTTAQYQRDGVVFRPVRDAPPIPVHVIWRRHDPHPSTHAAIALLAELYRAASLRHGYARLSGMKPLGQGGGVRADAYVGHARLFTCALARTNRTGAPMELTKHTHACVTLDKEGSHLLIDPGAFTPNAAELVADAETILITHEHFDHFDEAVLTAALDARPDLRVYGPAAVVDRWSDRAGQVKAVAAGERFDVDGFDVSVFGGTHALIHRDVPQVANVGYLVDGRVYHPGDSYFVPDAPVTTLLVPTSGPWTKLGDAVDFVRAVGPSQAVQIHEIMLSEVGQQSMAMFLSPKMLTPDVALTIAAIGDTISV